MVCHDNRVVFKQVVLVYAQRVHVFLFRFLKLLAGQVDISKQGNDVCRAYVVLAVILFIDCQGLAVGRLAFIHVLLGDENGRFLDQDIGDSRRPWGLNVW